ncbi:ABC transporter ATP-binding protein [Candidatus Soleaferrea massiliensis]|uniref:ABC transporter ATP-binding protein n=1 Tax=Candidatus Soleaferrea massiliensis TaxID=1470354 RepID=UPI00058C869E|nr:ATP-binding cassette domain-containing protein [Candidatus Soleaferrea massiliensis]
MPAISFLDYSFTYPGAKRPALHSVHCAVDAGAFVLLCGPTGSGKTTLLRSIKPETAPAGAHSGTITVLGQDRDKRDSRGQALRVGYVAQSPDNQLVMDCVWHELAFGLENMGLESHIIRRRMAETANFFGIGDWIQKKVYTLSGGQKQILNLASVMAMQPDILLLDEPTAQLDPIAAKEFLQMVKRINEELGTTVILSEHRLEDVLPVSDTVLYMLDGRLEAQLPPADFVRWVYAEQRGFAEALPACVRTARKLGCRRDDPLCVRDGRTWLGENRRDVKCISKDAAAQNDETSAEAALSAKNLWYRYEKNEAFVIRDAALALHRQEIHAIVGGNGSGKSTLLQLLCGTLKPNRGRVKREGTAKIGLLSQDPKSLFTADTLYEELRELSSSHHYGKDEIDGMMETFSLTALKDRHPYDLSGGEMQKAALAKILLLSPDILLLDEPTKGIDAAAKNEFGDILTSLKKDGKTILMVTHDVEFAARIADRCSMLFDGAVSCTDSGRSFFSSNIFYTTETNRMTRGFADGCVTVEDVGV